jgi:hypothetical protein
LAITRCHSCNREPITGSEINDRVHYKAVIACTANKHTLLRLTSNPTQQHVFAHVSAENMCSSGNTSRCHLAEGGLVSLGV